MKGSTGVSPVQRQVFCQGLRLQKGNFYVNRVLKSYDFLTPPFLKGGRGDFINRLKIPLNPPLEKGDLRKGTSHAATVVHPQ